MVTHEKVPDQGRKFLTVHEPRPAAAMTFYAVSLIVCVQVVASFRSAGTVRKKKDILPFGEHETTLRLFLFAHSSAFLS